MDVFTVARICIRRWYVFVPLLLLSASAAFRLAAQAAPEFEARGSLVVLPADRQGPSRGAQRQAVNPFAITAGGDRVAASALMSRLQSDDVRRQVAAEAEGSYVITAITNQPIILVQALSSRPSEAQAVVDSVRAAADAAFSSLQLTAGSPEDQLLQIVPVDSVSATGAAYPGRSKLFVGVVGGGLILAIMAATALDALRERVRHRSKGRSRRRTHLADAEQRPVPAAEDEVGRRPHWKASAESTFLASN